MQLLCFRRATSSIAKLLSGVCCLSLVNGISSIFEIRKPTKPGLSRHNSAAEPNCLRVHQLGHLAGDKARGKQLRHGPSLGSVEAVRDAFEAAVRWRKLISWIMTIIIGIRVTILLLLACARCGMPRAWDSTALPAAKLPMPVARLDNSWMIQNSIKAVNSKLGVQLFY